MTMAQRTFLSGLAWRAAASALCVLWLTACPDGYPTEDAPRVELSSMTQAQLLAALNELGAEPHLGKRWRYSLHPECELEVTVRGDDEGRRRVTLEGSEVGARAVDGVSEILLVPVNGSEMQAVTVLETQRWSDTVRARSLLTHLEVRCGQAEGPDS
jgi:hypothetical protein